MTIIQAQPLKAYGISGPASVLDNEVPIFDGITGKKIKAAAGIICPSSGRLKMSSTAPHLTLHNTAHEDTDYGRESEIIFKGEQSGGEETTLGKIQVAHDGTTDDQKGIMSFKINDGNDADAPGTKMTILADGNVGIGTDSPGGKLHVNVGAGGSGKGFVLDLTSEEANTYSRYASIDFRSYTTDLIGQFLATGNTYYSANANLPPNAVALTAIEPEGAIVLMATGNNGTLRFNTGGYPVANERMRITNTGNVGIGTIDPSAKLDINSDIIRLRTAKTPASAGAAGNQGDECWDADYHYRCVATNTWKRTALTTW